MRVVVVDQPYENFYPLSQCRPLWDLFYGMYHAYERIEKSAENTPEISSVSCHVRKDLFQFAVDQYPDKSIIVEVETGDTLFVSPFFYQFELIDFNKKNCVYYADGIFAAALLPPDISVQYDGSPDFFQKIKADKINIDIFMPEFIWNIVSNNGRIITMDFDEKSEIPSGFSHDVSIVGDRSRVVIGDNVRIDPMVVIDATKGPVYISAGCEINPFTRIEGPCYIGTDCMVLGAKIREGCSFGTCCRIGGEVEDSVFFPYANKYHDGFIGHACIGSWVNLGALATNSDLKNNYTPVVVETQYGRYNTGEHKIGCFIGDHTKCSIGTLMNTGTVIGSHSMVVHSGMMVRGHLPSFTMFIKNEFREITDVEAVCKTAETVMSRRNISMSQIYRNTVDDLYQKHSDN